MTFYRVSSAIIFFGLFAIAISYYFDIGVVKEEGQTRELSAAIQNSSLEQSGQLMRFATDSPAIQLSVSGANESDTLENLPPASVSGEPKSPFSRAAVAALHRPEEDPFKHNIAYGEDVTIEIGDYLAIDDAVCCDESNAQVKEIGEYLTP